MKDFERCKSFLLCNGWKDYTENGSEYLSFYRDNCMGIDMSKDEDEMVFIGENGDFLHLPINYFTLIGVLVEFRQLAGNYQSVRNY